MLLAVQSGTSVRSVGVLPRGDAGVTATIAAMQAAVDWSVYGDEASRALLEWALSRALAERPGDADGAVYWWLRRWFRYLADPERVELLRLPSLLLPVVRGGGVARCDCDDRAIVGASLLEVARRRGLTQREPVLVTVGRRPRALGGRFEHVFYGSIGPGLPLAVSNVLPSDPQQAVPLGEWGNVDLRRLKLWRLRPSAPGA